MHVEIDGALSLESWYEDNPLPNEPAEAIVILAGTVRLATPGQPYTFAAPDTYERLQHGVWLFKNWKPLPILVCGGAFDEKELFSNDQACLGIRGRSREVDLDRESFTVHT